MRYCRENGRIITTAGIARRGGRLFLARRSSGGSEHGRWEFPGGKCEGDESIEACLRREYLEEFAVEIIAGAEIGRVKFEHKDDIFVLLGVEITLVSDPVKLREHSEWGWFTQEEAENLDLIESDRALLGMIP